MNQSTSMLFNTSTLIPPPSPVTSTKASSHSISLPAAPVAIKAPVFTERNPAAWFRILEAQFNLSDVVRGETKFYHVLASLTPDLVSQLSTHILNNADYDDLKAALCKHRESTKPELFDRFLSTTPIKGRRSHYLTEMRRLASQTGDNDDLFRHKFLLLSLQFDEVGKLVEESVTLYPAYDRVSVVSHVD